tara:strand:+ start:2336 stop:3031 length:696 start_codon:yes stop_codon:yes gene_type:complete
VSKETTHRADELKALGWSNEDVLRYTELWDYRQRWGAINLERDDRLFLRKAEAALPKIISSKSVPKKPTQEKSYYRWIRFYLDSMNQAELSFDLEVGAKGIWTIILEEELRALDYYEPVLGLPDTIKAKSLDPYREAIIEKITNNLGQKVQTFKFDFVGPLEELKKNESNNWRFLRESNADLSDIYPVIKQVEVDPIRSLIRKELIPLIKETFPSLVDSEKSLPPDDWSRN